MTKSATEYEAERISAEASKQLRKKQPTKKKAAPKKKQVEKIVEEEVVLEPKPKLRRHI